jgi:hypothetical protein
MNPIKKNHDAMLRTGAMALAAAGASTAAHAATVQITFNNSYISTTSGNHLVTDFGGDNVSDVRGFAVGNAAFVSTIGSRLLGLAAGHTSPGLGSGDGSVFLGEARVFVPGGVAMSSGVVAFTLVDALVRGGAPTAGWLDMTATGRPGGEFGRVGVHRYVFDDTTGLAPGGVAHADAAYPEYVAVAVPEPSGLGLLALGAGGLLARRRRAMAA